MENIKAYFEPQRVNDIFVNLCKLPHGSGNEDTVRSYIIREVEQYNRSYPGKPVQIIHYRAEAREPGERNIILRKAGTGHGGNQAPVILQAHLDMVCIPSPDIFPIKLNMYNDTGGVPVLKGGGFTAGDGTTLGADNGIGVAIALAIMTDPHLECGPLECLFTVQEEVDMGGVRDLDIAHLTGNRLLNLDSEDCSIITYGSAGGFHASYQWIPGFNTIPQDYKTISLELNGLSGGHSGGNINEGRGNAIKALAHAFDHLRKVRHKDFSIIEFTTGNDRHNAIPNNARLVFTCPSAESEVAREKITHIMNLYKEELKESDPGFAWQWQEIGNPHYRIDADHSNHLLDLVLLIPQGPLKMIDGIPGVVETSVNLAVIKASPAGITVNCSNRSASEYALDAVQALHETIARLFGIKMVIQLDSRDAGSVLRTDYMKAHSRILIFSDRYPGWLPDKDYGLLKAAEEVYRETYGEKAFTEVVHAGLECGWIIRKFTQAGRKVECIAIGPTVHTPHGWNERLETGSVSLFYDCLLKIIRKIQP